MFDLNLLANLNAFRVLCCVFNSLPSQSFRRLFRKMKIDEILMYLSCYRYHAMSKTLKRNWTAVFDQIQWMWNPVIRYYFRIKNNYLLISFRRWLSSIFFPWPSKFITNSIPFRLSRYSMLSEVYAVFAVVTRGWAVG